MESINIIIGKSKFRIFWHIFFWLIVLIYYTLFFGHQGGYYWLTFRFVVFMLPVAIGTTYLFNYYLIPKYLFQKRIARFILFSVYSLITSFYLISLMIFPFLILNPGPVNFGELDKSLIDIYFLVVGMYMAILVAIMIKLLKYAYERQHLHLQLMKEKTQAELEMLRSQINPHFLFNTLNNIYTLSLKKSEQTPEAVLKLSEMLDYLLYDCNSNKVPLKKEIILIENYLYLQQLRYSNRLKINFKKDNHITDQQIAPMLLLPFIENSFKHGVGKHRNNARIDINLSVNAKGLLFLVSNSQANIKPTSEINSSGGIGLTNVQKRLGLIYPEHYTLNIRDLEKIYEIELTLTGAL